MQYEEVCVKSYTPVPMAVRGLGEYLRFYNEEWLYQALGYRAVADVPEWVFTA